MATSSTSSNGELLPQQQHHHHHQQQQEHQEQQQQQQQHHHHQPQPQQQSEQQQYSLRWNDFHASILSSFRSLREEEDFVDVTLACSDNSFTAHKVVLSACSPYFRKVLKANPCSHPIVILKDADSSEIECLLQFMYHGEVSMAQDRLASFLSTAQTLQVRGLADVPTTVTKKPSGSTAHSAIPQNASAPTTPGNMWSESIRSELNDRGSSSPPNKRSRSYTPTVGNHVNSKSEMKESLLGQALEGGPTIHTSNNIQAQSTGEDSNSISDNEDTSNNDISIMSVKTEPMSEIVNESLEHRNSFPAALLSLQGLMPGPSGIHTANHDPNYVRRSLELTQRVRATDPRPCPKCGKIYRSAHTLRTHLEDKHTTCPGYRCVLCGTVAKSRNSLHSHMSRQHRGISTKDLPVLPMPSPFDPELASRLLAKAGVQISPAELRARASPTGPPRRGDMRLEASSMNRQPSEAGSSLCGGDDPEDLTLSMRYEQIYGSSTPNNNTVITKLPGNSFGVGGGGGGGGIVGGGASSNGKSSLLQDSREAQLAAFQQQSLNRSAIVDTFLQYMAENSGNLPAGLVAAGFNAENQAEVYARLLQMNAVSKLASRGQSNNYPIIGRDETRGTSGRENDNEHEVNSTAGEDEDDYSETEENDTARSEQ